MKRWEWCELLKSSHLSTRARIIGFCLSTYADDQGISFPSVARLAKDAGYKDERSAQYALAELVRHGYVYRRKRPFQTSLYTLTKPAWHATDRVTPQSP